MTKTEKQTPDTTPAKLVQTPASGGSYALDESSAYTLTERTQAQAGTYRTTKKEGE